jgi:TRAP-type C4-dicarboxylate transport system permease small subunit
MQDKISKLELKIEALYESQEVLKDKLRSLIKLVISMFLLLFIIAMLTGGYMISAVNSL